MLVMNGLSLWILKSHEGYGIYKKINNKYFDRLVIKIRSKFNTRLLHTNDSSSVIAENVKLGKRNLWFCGDQSPQSNLKLIGSVYEYEVPVYTGEFYQRNMIRRLS
jgi:KDO2-lipid IV(A) lauroyltransferase